MSAYEDTASSDRHRDKRCAFIGVDRPELLAHLTVGLDRVSTTDQPQQSVAVKSALRLHLVTFWTQGLERNVCAAAMLFQFHACYVHRCTLDKTSRTARQFVVVELFTGNAPVTDPTSLEGHRALSPLHEFAPYSARDRLE